MKPTKWTVRVTPHSKEAKEVVAYINARTNRGYSGDSNSYFFDEQTRFSSSCGTPGFRPDDYTELSYPQWLLDVKEELPPVWYVAYDLITKEEVGAWRELTYGSNVVSDQGGVRSDGVWYKHPPGNTPVLTLEQFRRLVLKQATPIQTKNDMNEAFTVDGDKFLRAAFIEQIKELGFTPYGHETDNLIKTNGRMIEWRPACPIRYVGVSEKKALHYTLPQDWNQALEAFKTTRQRFFYRIGDYVVIESLGRLIGGGCFLIGGTYRIKDLNDTGMISFEADETGQQNGYTDAGQLVLRGATDEEIRRYKDSRERRDVTVRYLDKFDNPATLVATVRAETVNAKGECVPMTAARNLLKTLEAIDIAGTPAWPIAVSRVDIGCCKGVTLDSLREIVNTAEALKYAING